MRGRLITDCFGCAPPKKAPLVDCIKRGKAFGRQRIGIDWRDPNADPAKLIELIEENPRVLLNPNIPLKVLSGWARYYPWFVERNDVLHMLRLEDPESFERLEKNIRRGWVDNFEHLTLTNRIKLGVGAMWKMLNELEATREGVPAKYAFTFREEDCIELARELCRATVLLLEAKKDSKLARKQRAAQEDIREEIENAGSREMNTGLAGSILGTALEASRGTNNILEFLIDILYYGTEDVVGVEAADELRTQLVWWFARQVRGLWYEEQRSAQREKILAQIQENQNRQAMTKEKIKAAVAQAKQGAEQAAEILAKPETNYWPLWVGLGVVVGVGAVLIIGPELLAGMVVRTAVVEIVEIVTVNEIRAVSVSAFIKGAVEIGKTPQAAAFLEELTAKLSAQNVQVLAKEVAENIIKVIR